MDREGRGGEKNGRKNGETTGELQAGFFRIASVNSPNGLACRRPREPLHYCLQFRASVLISFPFLGSPLGARLVRVDLTSAVVFPATCFITPSTPRIPLPQCFFRCPPRLPRSIRAAFSQPGGALQAPAAACTLSVLKSRPGKHRHNPGT